MKYRLFIPLIGTALLAACAVGPDYQKPEVTAPAQWAEQTDGDWAIAQPQDQQAKGPWWEIFADPALNQLEDQALRGSFTLQTALARLEQARALLGIAESGRSPSADISLRSARTQTSSNRPTATGTGEAVASLQNDHILGLGVAYELDLFGRVRRDVEASSAGLEQAKADLENVRLILAADVATAYFALRTQEADIALLKQSLDLQEKALVIVQKRVEFGAAGTADLAQQTQLISNTRSQLQLSLRTQAQQQHALATLLGIQANDFHLESRTTESQTSVQSPEIPSVLPSQLLQRRPDIASAERAVANANAQIGLAKSAWFPSLRISATDGLESRQWANLLDAPSAIWSIGLGLSQTVFDGGRTRARVEQASAGHRLATANYRQTVLKAFQEVEDGLSSRRTLALASQEAQRAVDAASKWDGITEQRYRLGASTALEHFTSQQNRLTSQRLFQQLEGQRWANMVFLIKALGGQW
ncbi:MAG: hypothetical protein RIR18_2428 [Pseudomonadota bacterium]|jgi:NodT family efflux transporter outer membrane factor (OMF) lipoprotein